MVTKRIDVPLIGTIPKCLKRRGKSKKKKENGGKEDYYSAIWYHPKMIKKNIEKGNW